MKTYTLTVDWARVDKNCDKIIWHNDPEKTTQVDCEEDVKMLKKHVIDELKKYGSEGNVCVTCAATESLVFNYEHSCYEERGTEIEVSAFTKSSHDIPSKKYGNYVRVRAFEDWMSWITNSQES